MLLQAGYDVQAIDSGVDDSALAKPADRPIDLWAAELAGWKAEAAMRRIPPAELRSNRYLLLAADTIVDVDSQAIGTPATGCQAAEMIRRLCNRRHDVVTAAVIKDPDKGVDRVIVDRATVSVGHIPDAEVDRYIQSGSWSGKAGAYNLSERVDAGWPITWVGDPGTVMGLPIRLLKELLHREWGILPEPREQTS